MSRGGPQLALGALSPYAPPFWNPRNPSFVFRLHRAVLFAVLDHFVRRHEGQQRVIGSLLGRVDEVRRTVQEKGGSPLSPPSLAHHSAPTRVALFQKFPKAGLVGCSGTFLAVTSFELD